MMQRLLRPARLTARTRYLALVVIAALALLLVSCAWGIVTDSQTGQAVPGAQVTFHDSEGGSGTASANENGLYAFELQKGPIPARGTVTYEVTAPGYETLTVQRDVQYDDNTAGTWEAQDFALAPEGGRYYNEEAGFSIEFPADWEVTGGFWAELMGAAVIAESPLEGPGDWYAEYVVVLTEELAHPGTTAEGLLSVTMIAFRNLFREPEEMVSDFREDKSGEITIDNTDAAWATYSLFNEALGTRIKGVVYALVKGRQAFLIACVAEASKFRIYDSVFQQIAESFRFE